MVGDQIAWVKGEPVRHARCPVGRSLPARKAAPRKASFPSAAPEAGAVRMTLGDVDRAAGDVIRVRNAPSTPGGGPDKTWYTVLAARRNRPSEDMGSYDWSCSVWVRPATDAEVAPVRARTQAVAARKTTVEWLTRTLRAGTSVPEVEAERTPSAIVSWTGSLSEGGGVQDRWYGVTEDRVVTWHGGSYDDYRRSSSWVPRTSPAGILAERIIRELGAGTPTEDALLVLADACEEYESARHATDTVVA